MLFLGCGPNTIRIAPPLIVNKDQADTAIAVLEECISIVEKVVPAFGRARAASVRQLF